MWNGRIRYERVLLLSSWLVVVVGLVVLCQAQQQEEGRMLFPPRSGPIVDVSCDVEQLEEANDSQLFTILHDLKNTEFFRQFAVDLDHRCPLENFGKNKVTPTTKPTKPTTTTTTTTTFSPFDPLPQEEEDDDDGKCASEGIPDFEPEAGPACGVALDDNNPFPFGTSSSFSSSSPMDTTYYHTQQQQQHQEEEEEEEETIVEPEKKKEEKEGEYDCKGIEGEERDEDEEDVPLCSLTEEDFQSYTFDPDSSTPIRDLLSSALMSIQSSILRSMGWESESQRKTFAWSNPSDPVIGIISDEESADTCDNDNRSEPSLPDTFWMDICSSIHAGDGEKVVNLALNPERNTGYNGTHIWRAIYEENCIDLDGSAPMCYEERVLYRLISGLHASTTLSIAMNNKPPNKKKGRLNWEPNPEYFYQKFESNPDYIRNLHFSYVVLLRALKKAYPVLYSYDIKTGNIVDDETAQILLKRLLDSSILSSCNGVFTAFDESLMFQEQQIKEGNNVVSLQENFKGVFHNISSILDCVQCQQCKLHGKMAMLGYGTALKILFLPRNELLLNSLSRNEFVAFINTIAKFSESLKHVRELTSLYWAQHDSTKTTTAATSTLPTNHNQQPAVVVTDDPMDVVMGLISSLGQAGRITEERERQLISLALSHDADLLLLAKYYATDVNKFLEYSNLLQLSPTEQQQQQQPDAIIVGSGLAGLSAALNVLDRGGTVLVIEKEHTLGGNSNKASSGINACCPNNATTDDYLEQFRLDTTKSAGSAAQPHLIDVLVQNSASAVQWLKERVGVDLSLLAQLGGHASKRTHRPKNGMAGAEIMFGLQREVKKYQKSGMVQILTDTRVTQLLTNPEGHVTGVRVTYLNDSNKEDDSSSKPVEYSSQVVVLATGGFASDRSQHSYLATHRPELLHMPATAGAFSTGDGITLATDLGAGTIDMDKVQVHPTGWVDPTDPTNPTKVLAAELMRGVGGILLNSSGKRFCNELGTRAYVTDKMLSHDEYYAANQQWKQDNENLSFSLILSSSAALDGKKHVDHYMHKGLLVKLQGIRELSQWMGVDDSVLLETMRQYQTDANVGLDEWGKTSFRGVFAEDLENETFYAGSVTPVLHYCMGGITIDTQGHVMDSNGTIIPGLYAAGEVSGGVHGNNRLGGNSLLECTVFGSMIGQTIPIQDRSAPQQQKQKFQPTTSKVTSSKNKPISMEELKSHNTSEDCWVAIHGIVYDLTDFADEHPAGAQSITILAGTDGTEAFQAIHNENLLDDFDEEIMGTLVIQ